MVEEKRGQGTENPFLETAVQAALSAGKLLKDALGKEFDIEFKGEIDIVTELDRAAEREIISIIESRYPTHGILTEESSERASKSGYRWIIDPLDGTTNFSHAFPVFCVSIALERDGVVILGVVFDPTREELFTATLSGGAYLNGKQIQVSKATELDTSLLATGFPYDIRTSKENNLNHFANFAVRVQAIRRAGSAALDLCYVASGRYDGFWELKLKPWDIAAGTLIVKEAGGRVSDFTGTAVAGIENKRLLASNGLIHGAMSEILTNFNLIQIFKMEKIDDR
jgi:myo-inositol-1(or 4)-monophosphatase